MTALPLEILLGIYLGLLTGIVPAFVAGGLGFIVRYFSGVTLPGFGVVVLALSIASVQGGLLGLVEPDIAQSPRLFVAVLVVLMLALYAHSQGDALGASLPRRLSLRRLRQRTLSADVIEIVGAVGQVTIRPTGEIRDLEGYPPLPPALRRTLKAGSWRFPADLPLAELGRRLEDRLRTDHGLADVAVTVDERGRATIAAAPPSSGLSKRVQANHRAVSLSTLIPTGLARGDVVRVWTGESSVAGDRDPIEATVLSVQATADTEGSVEYGPDVATDGGVEAPTPVTAATDTATLGGRGRVTVSVPREMASRLLAADACHLEVVPRGTTDLFEAFARIREAGYDVRHVTIQPREGPAGASDTPRGDHVSSAGVDPAAHDLEILAVRRDGADTDDRRRGWIFGPGLERPLEPGDEAYVAGRTVDLRRFGSVIR